MYQSGRARDEAKKRKSHAKSGRVGIYVIRFSLSLNILTLTILFSIDCKQRSRYQ